MAADDMKDNGRTKKERGRKSDFLFFVFGLLSPSKLSPPKTSPLNNRVRNDHSIEIAAASWLAHDSCQAAAKIKDEG